MPKIYATEADRLIEQELKSFHGELYAEGVRNATIAKWLGCTEQNVSQLWKNRSFSYKQILVMKDKLNKMRSDNCSE